MADDNYIYLGKAVEYPITVVNGAAVITTGKNVIEGSIIMILTTPKGSRYFLPEFGSQINELLFEPNDDILVKLLEVYIVEAISRWEKRIKIADLVIIPGDEVIVCTIHYRILASNEIDSFVYPFYRKPLTF